MVWLWVTLAVLALLALGWLFCLMPRRGERRLERLRRFRYAHRGLFNPERGVPENSVKALESYVSSIRSFIPPAIREWRISGGVDTDAETVSLQEALDQIVSAISEEQ